MKLNISEITKKVEDNMYESMVQNEALASLTLYQGRQIQIITGKVVSKVLASVVATT